MMTMVLKKKINLLVSNDKIEWKKHALQKIFERAISRNEVKQAILNLTTMRRDETN